MSLLQARCGTGHTQQNRGAWAPPCPPLSCCCRGLTTGSAAGVLPPHLIDKAHGCSGMKYLTACQVIFRSTRQHTGQIIPSTATSPGGPLTGLGFLRQEAELRANLRNLPPPLSLFLAWDEGKWFWEKTFTKKEGTLSASPSQQNKTKRTSYPPRENREGKPAGPSFLSHCS